MPKAAQVSWSAVAASATEWTRQYAQEELHDGIERLVDTLTPGNAELLATDAAMFDDVLAVHAMAVSAAEALLLDAVTSARSAGRTWTEIGDALGMSRQEAQARFTGVGTGSELVSAGSATTGVMASTDSDDDAAIQALGLPNRRLLKLPFVDVEPLNRAGKFGWHVVKTTTDRQWTAAHHIIEQSDEQWEHVYTRSRKKLPANEGWMRIDTPRWWGVSYWVRPLGIPVLPGNPDPDKFAL